MRTDLAVPAQLNSPAYSNPVKTVALPELLLSGDGPA
jgi:hypothetical protein